jgi:glycosyltransferase involved in cell wall biosynthesis
MRIAILSNTFPPDNHGGAERVAALQAELLSSTHEVRVWAAGTESGNGVEEGIMVCRFASVFAHVGDLSVFQKCIFHLVTDRGCRHDVANDILAWKPDVLLTHNLTGCGMATPQCVQARGVKWIHTLHDIQLTDPSGQEWKECAGSQRVRAWRFFWSRLRRWRVGTPDVIVSPTQWLMEWHTRHGFRGRSSVVLPNPVSLTPERLRTLRVPATIAYVGRLSDEKGFRLFLRAAAACDPALVSRIMVVGGGPLLGNARAVSDPRWDVRGPLPFDEAHAIIADADLLIAPSQILENQQQILLQAMAEGTPVIATDVGGTAETLAGVGCPLVPCDVDAAFRITAHVHALLGDPEEWQGVSRRLRARAERHAVSVYRASLEEILLSR